MKKNNYFYVQYSFNAKNFIEAKKIAFDICIEQTIEFPFELLKNGYIKKYLIGKIKKLFKINKNRYFTEIAYNNMLVGTDYTQFLNIIFGNISLKKGIKVESFVISNYLKKLIKGPKFGIDGMRKILNVYNRPLTCSAIKPVGLNTKKLSQIAYKFALGGIDIIKDDHGLANQIFAPFEKRVYFVSKAVKKAIKKTGKKVLYTPNITGDSENEIIKKAYFAKKCGVGGVVISGFLTGIPLIKKLSEDNNFNLPILFHPAFSGSYITSKESGFSFYSFFGQLPRTVGADIVIFPNFDSRFSFKKDDCKKIILGCKSKMLNIKPCLPAPGGGITINKIKNLKKFYGNDVVFLMAGGLFHNSADIIKNCQEFINLIS